MGTADLCRSWSLRASAVTQPGLVRYSMPSAYLVLAGGARASVHLACVSTAPTARHYRQQVQDRGMRCVCPERRDAQKHRLRKGRQGGVPPRFGATAYKGRNVVERAFNRLTDLRAIATRYEKRGYDIRSSAPTATYRAMLSNSCAFRLRRAAVQFDKG